jgi:superfamily II DNA or RNA helicase
MIRRDDGQYIAEYLTSAVLSWTPRIGADKKLTLYHTLHDGTTWWILLPRGAIRAIRAAQFALRCKRNVTAIRHLSQCLPDNMSRDFLYSDQELLVARICDELRDSISRAICLDLRAGYGKTFIAAGVIARMRARTLYIVPTHELARQAAEDLRVTLGCEVLCAQHHADVFEMRSAPIVIVVINTVLSGEVLHARHRGLCDNFALTIFDEVHMYCTEKRNRAFHFAQSNWMLGMSATIGERRDGFDNAIAHHFGNILRAQDVEGFTTYEREDNFRVLVRVANYYAEQEYAQNLRHESTGTVFAHYMYEQFARDNARNQLIIQYVRDLISRGHNIFIFAEERAHIELLAQMCAQMCASVVCATFYGGIDVATRNVARDDARIICATYSYSGTGVSISRMTAIILATPRHSNIKQIVGRILRRGSDASIEREVIDIVDQRTCLRHQFAIRANVYNYYDARIVNERHQSSAP